MNRVLYTRHTLRSGLAVLFTFCLVGSPAFAVDYYHLDTSVARSTLMDQSHYSVGNANTTPAAAGTINSLNDNLFFYNSAVTGPVNREFVLGSQGRSIGSMTFGSNAGTTQIDRDFASAGGGNNTVLFIGAGGITVDSGAGAVTFGSLIADRNQRVTVGAAASFSIRNNSSSDLAFNRGFDGRTFDITNVITIDGSGSGGTIFDGEGIKANSGGRDLALVIDTTGAGVVKIEVASTYAGGTTLKRGKLEIRSGQALGSGLLTINGGTLAAVGGLRTLNNNVVIGGNFALGGSGAAIQFNGTVDLGGATRVVSLGNSATFSGVISNGGLTVAGNTGTLTMNAANTYSGATRINSGTLALGASGSLANSSEIRVASGATFDVAAVSGGFTLASGQKLSGSGTVVGNTTIGSGGILSPAGTLTFNDNLTLSAGSSTAMEIAGGGAGEYDVVSGDGFNTIMFGGTLQLAFMNDYSLLMPQKLYLFTNWGTYTDGSDFSAIQQTGPYRVDTVEFGVDDDGGFIEWSGGWSLAPVIPEPGTIALLLIGAGMVAGIRRRTMST